MVRILGPALATLLCTLALAAASTARAQRPFVEDLVSLRRDAEAQPRASITLLFENDNKLLGIWQLFAEDGDDLGRTHALTLAAQAPIRDDLEAWVDVQTTLFSEQVRDQYGLRVTWNDDLEPNPNPRKDRHTHFAEVSYFRLGLSWHLDDYGLTSSFALGGSIVNRENVSLGATGQQRAFHNFLEIFDPNMKEYRYMDDGGGIIGGFVSSAALAYRNPFFENERVRITVDAMTGLWFNTILEGTYIGLRGGMEFGFGRRTVFNTPLCTFRVAQYVEGYLAAPAGLMDTRVELNFHTRVVDILIWYDRYWGDPNNAYYVYNFNNSTTTMGFVFRIP